MSIGTRIKEARAAKGFTQEELASLINVTAGAVGQFERNENLPSLATLVLLCVVLGVTTDWILEVNTSPLGLVLEVHAKTTSISFIREISTILESERLSDEQLRLLLLVAKQFCIKNRPD